MTGAQLASTLLRQCWGNSPLSPEEDAQVENIASLGGHLAPCLILQAQELRLSATQLAPLHITSGPPLGEGPKLDPDAPINAAISYLHEALDNEFQGWCHDHRLRLSHDEEFRVMSGMRMPRASSAPPAWFRSGIHRNLNIPDRPVADTCVKEMEERIVAICVTLTAAPPPGDIPAFPLKESPQALPLETEMLKELKGSWEAWHTTPTASLAENLTPETLSIQLQAWKVRARICDFHRLVAQTYCTDCINRLRLYRLPT